MDDTHTQFTLIHSTNCIRSARNVLQTIEVIVGEAVQWRNIQPIHHHKYENSGLEVGTNNNIDNNHDDKDNENEGDDKLPLNNNDYDPGELKWLEQMLHWASALCYQCINYSKVLKSNILLLDDTNDSTRNRNIPFKFTSLSNKKPTIQLGKVVNKITVKMNRKGVFIPNELYRSVPQLQFASEKVLISLQRIAKSHSIQLSKPDELLKSFHRSGNGILNEVHSLKTNTCTFNSK